MYHTSQLTHIPSKFNDLVKCVHVQDVLFGIQIKLIRSDDCDEVRFMVRYWSNIHVAYEKMNSFRTAKIYSIKILPHMYIWLLYDGMEPTCLFKHWRQKFFFFAFIYIWHIRHAFTCIHTVFIAYLLQRYHLTTFKSIFCHRMKWSDRWWIILINEHDEILVTETSQNVYLAQKIFHIIN